MSSHSVVPKHRRTVIFKRLPTVLEERGRCRSSHYSDIAEGLWPRPVLLGKRSVGWPDFEVDQINAAVLAGWPKAQIRELVARIEAARRAAA